MSEISEVFSEWKKGYRAAERRFRNGKPLATEAEIRAAFDKEKVEAIANRLGAILDTSQPDRQDRFDSRHKISAEDINI